MDWYLVSGDGEVERITGRICGRDQIRTNARACWGCKAYRGTDWNGERRQTGMTPDGDVRSLSWGEYPEWQRLTDELLAALEAAGWDTDDEAVQGAQGAIDAYAEYIGNPDQRAYGLRFRAFVELDERAAHDYYERHRETSEAWRRANPDKVRQQRQQWYRYWRKRWPSKYQAKLEANRRRREERRLADPQGYREAERKRKAAWRERQSDPVNVPASQNSSIGVADYRTESLTLSRARARNTRSGGTFTGSDT